MPSVANLRTNVLLRGEDTSGQVSVTEIVVPPHSAGPPLHAHNFDEAFYILGGELIFQVDDALMTKGVGELCFAPRNVAHTLANHSGAPARYVLVCTPAGFERHWARIAADAAGIEPPQWARQPIPKGHCRRPADRGANMSPGSRLPTPEAGSAEPRSRSREANLRVHEARKPGRRAT